VQRLAEREADDESDDDGPDGERDPTPVAVPPRLLAPSIHGSKSVAPRT